jgi:hypothetical protein
MGHLQSFWKVAGYTTPALFLMLVFFVTTPVWATEDTETLRRQMDDLKRQMEVLQE